AYRPQSLCVLLFFFSSRRRHTRFSRDWSSDVCSSDLNSSLEFSTLKRTVEFMVTTVGGTSFGSTTSARSSSASSWSLPGIELPRSEERRVGKEWRSRWGRESKNNKEMQQQSPIYIEDR